MFPMILLCVAVLCLAVSAYPAPPSPQGWIAILLAVVALLAVCLRWSPL